MVIAVASCRFVADNPVDDAAVRALSGALKAEVQILRQTKIDNDNLRSQVLTFLNKSEKVLKGALPKIPAEATEYRNLVAHVIKVIDGFVANAPSDSGELVDTCKNILRDFLLKAQEVLTSGGGNLKELVSRAIDPLIAQYAVSEFTSFFKGIFGDDAGAINDIKKSLLTVIASLQEELDA